MFHPFWLRFFVNDSLREILVREACGAPPLLTLSYLPRTTCSQLATASLFFEGFLPHFWGKEIVLSDLLTVLILWNDWSTTVVMWNLVIFETATKTKKVSAPAPNVKQQPPPSPPPTNTTHTDTHTQTVNDQRGLTFSKSPKKWSDYIRRNKTINLVGGAINTFWKVIFPKTYTKHRSEIILILKILSINYFGTKSSELNRCPSFFFFFFCYRCKNGVGHYVKPLWKRLFEWGSQTPTV